MYNVVREVIMLRILKVKSFFMCCLFKDKQQLFIQLLNLQTGRLLSDSVKTAFKPRDIRLSVGEDEGGLTRALKGKGERSVS